MCFFNFHSSFTENNLVYFTCRFCFLEMFHSTYSSLGFTHQPMLTLLFLPEKEKRSFFLFRSNSSRLKVFICFVACLLLFFLHAASFPLGEFSVFTLVVLLLWTWRTSKLLQMLQLCPKSVCVWGCYQAALPSLAEILKTKQWKCFEKSK